MLSLILNEERPFVQKILYEILQREDEIELFSGKPFLFFTQLNLDAYIASSYEAHELYGIGEDLRYKKVLTALNGKRTTIAREVIIAPTHSKQDLPPQFPPLVVISPNFPGHAEFSRSNEFEVAFNDGDLTSEELTYVHISQSLLAVRDFNRTSNQPIRRLGLILASIGIPGSASQEEQKREIEIIFSCFHDILHG